MVVDTEGTGIMASGDDLRVRLQTSDWLRLLGIALGLVPLIVGAMLYVLTPRQVHAEDVARLESDIQANLGTLNIHDTKGQALQRTLDRLEESFERQNIALQAIYTNQQLILRELGISRRRMAPAPSFGAPATTTPAVPSRGTP